MSPTGITIRAAAAADAETLAVQRSRLFQELGQHPPAGEAGAFETHSAAAFTDGLARGVCFAWVAEAGGTAIGSVALLVFPRLPSPASFARHEGYLLNGYTEPKSRGLGVATALVTTAITRARDLGLARIRLHATAQGQQVYAAAGFVSRADEMELRLD